MTDTIINDTVFSCLSGHNLYQPTGIKNTLTHVLSGTNVSIRFIDAINSVIVERQWRRFIERPVNIQNITWPVDIVSINKDRMGLIFRQRAFPNMQPMKTLLYSAQALDWRTDLIKAICRNLLKTLQDLHDGGYAYHAFDMNQMFYSVKDNSVMIHFSLTMAHHGDNLTSLEVVDPDLVGVEFLPPWIPFDRRNRMAMIDDYYATAAMLFRLLVGRMPYQGRTMDGQGDMMDPLRDTDPQEHEHMFRHYHDHPIFIFDPKDTSNAIGEHSNEYDYIERWETLPERIRNMFIDTFSQENLELTYLKKKVYSIKEWAEALTAEGVI